MTHSPGTRSADASGAVRPAPVRPGRAPLRLHGAAGSRIADELRSAILAGSYAPGTRIRQEDLADRHGASRVPVREALRMLEAEGLVTLVANTGAWVSRLTVSECEEMYQIRERVEPLLLRMNVPLLTVETIARLDALALEMESSADVEEFLVLDREFHLSCYGSAETSVLGETVERLWNRTQHYRRAFTRMFRSEGDRSAHYDHHLLVHALERRDADEAERVLAGHIRRTRLALVQHPEVFS